MNVIVLTAVLSCLNSGVYVTARVLFAMADKGDAPRWLTAVNKRQVPARAILLGSAFGFVVMLMRDVAPERLFNFLLNSCGALMLFTYIFVVRGAFPLSVQGPGAARRAGAKLVAGGAGAGDAGGADRHVVHAQQATGNGGEPRLPGGDRRGAGDQARDATSRLTRVEKRRTPHHLRTGMGRSGCARASRKVSCTSRL